MDNLTNSLPQDPSSYSKPDHATTKHFDLDWTINFSEKTISGSILLHFDIKDSTVNQLILDSRELNISKVICENSGQSLKHEVDKHDAKFGSKVSITLPLEQLSKKLLVRIFYSTSPSAVGLLWLNPSQTSGKKFPFLFSQCQPINARSLMPCQDTPRVKATYSAIVKCDSNLVALMSALREEDTSREDEGLIVYKFRQPVAIASYLVAIVVGDLVSDVIGPRSKVWAEKEVIEASAYEFADTEKMLAIAESVCGEYVWQQYDVLVLPPSFPYGGMENPCLTFVTPTLLAGDRSLANVIAHEICHSWTGNLVTNCSWEHFWLNEGFTVFCERKIAKLLNGTPAMHMSAIQGWEDLKDCIQTRGSNDPLTSLIPSLVGVDPEDAYSTVPYEKGHTFLWYLQELVGGSDEFEPFLKSYFDKYRHQSIDSQVFKTFFLNYFASKSSELKVVDWNDWFNTPGMPPYEPKFDTSLIDSCLLLCKSWADWDETKTCPFTTEDLAKFSSDQIILWLSKILDSTLTLKKVKKMNEVYKMEMYGNAEIKFRWLRLCIKVRWDEKLENILSFINSQGRMKFVRPIYRDLYEWEAMREKGIANFNSHKKSMMHVSVHTLSKDLHIDD